MTELSHEQTKRILRLRNALSTIERESLEHHLETCDECRAYAATISRLGHGLEYKWRDPILSPGEITKISMRITQGERKHQIINRLFQVVQITVWASLAVFLVIGLTFSIERLLPQSPEPLKEDIQWEERDILEESLFAEQDLDCDGNIERLFVKRNTFSVNNEDVLRIFHVSLETATETGPQRVWEYFVDGVEAKYFLDPELIQINSCETFIAIPVKIYGKRVGEVGIFRWNNGEVAKVLSTAGWLKGVASEELGLDWKSCTVERTYIWNGEALVLKFEKEQSNDCR
jgi:hypothetical protein